MRHDPATLKWLNAERLVVSASAAMTVAAALILLHDPALAGWRSIIAMSARCSLVLFCLAFSASSLHRLWPGGWRRWPLRNRRYLGLSFAVSHTIHIAALVVFGVTAPALYASVGTWTNGMLAGLAYVFVLAMAATSFDGAVIWLGRARWRMLHVAGSYYIWLIFAIAFGKRVLRHPESFYSVAIIILILALSVRLMTAPRRNMSIDRILSR